MSHSNLARVSMVAAAVALLVMVACSLSLQKSPDGDELGASASFEDYTGTILVNVTDNVGRPMTEATVRIIGNQSDSWSVDDQGQVTITGLLADSNGTEYALAAECVGYESGSASVVVTPSNTSYVNISVDGGTITGIVSDDSGLIAGANVSLEALSINITTDSSGRYIMDGVKAGSYTITAFAPNHDSLTKGVTLLVGGTVYLDFDLASQTGSISGTVMHASTEEPIEGANVSVRVEGITPVTVTVASGADGTYYVPNIPAGTYSVTASLEGFNTSTVTGIEVESGVATEDVDIYLEEKPTKLWGTVRSGTILLVGANVSIWATDFFALSSIEGKYEIDGIPAGIYTVEASLQGYLNVTVIGMEVKKGAELTLDFNLTGLPGGLYGVVVDSNTGSPLSGVRVSLLPQRETITNINGEFEFTGLKEGNYTVRFALDGYRPVEIESIVITHEEMTQLGEIHLEKTRDSFGGFIFGFDLAHSMMILALFLTIVILALAVVLRIRTFESPDKAPAVYDELYDEEAEAEGTDEAGKDRLAAGSVEGSGEEDDEL
ncbi:MAG TPA: carboxypeptidase regulatory-like domain-containing protein [Thermoplasmata archaeon]|nr:carboxypeptidase regulatory-like domain-containing protein [Thermoplasmata archaeon]